MRNVKSAQKTRFPLFHKAWGTRHMSSLHLNSSIVRLGVPRPDDTSGWLCWGEFTILVWQASNAIGRLHFGLLALAILSEAFPVRSLDHLCRHLLPFPPQGAADWLIWLLEVTTAKDCCWFTNLLQCLLLGLHLWCTQATKNIGILKQKCPKAQHLGWVYLEPFLHPGFKRHHSSDIVWHLQGSQKRWSKSLLRDWSGARVTQWSGDLTCLMRDRRTSRKCTLSPIHRGRSMWISLMAFGLESLRGSCRLSQNSDSLLRNAQQLN